MDTGINYITEAAFGCLFDARWGRTEKGKDVSHPINLPCISKESLQNVKQLLLHVIHMSTDFEMLFNATRSRLSLDSNISLQ